MPKPPQVMSIHLSPEQTERLLTWAQKGLTAEMEADIEPSGYCLEVSIYAGGDWVEAVGIGGRLDLGDVKVEIVDVDEA